MKALLQILISLLALTANVFAGSDDVIIQYRIDPGVVVEYHKTHREEILINKLVEGSFQPVDLEYTKIVRCFNGNMMQSLPRQWEREYQKKLLGLRACINEIYSRRDQILGFSKEEADRARNSSFEFYEEFGLVLPEEKASPWEESFRERTRVYTDFLYFDPADAGVKAKIQEFELGNLCEAGTLPDFPRSQSGIPFDSELQELVFKNGQLKKALCWSLFQEKMWEKVATSFGILEK